MSPNPANSILNIELITEEQNHIALTTTSALSSSSSSSTLSGPMEVKLYNKFSEVVRQGQIEGQHLSLEVATLPQDLYYLHIVYQGQIVHQ